MSKRSLSSSSEKVTSSKKLRIEDSSNTENNYAGTLNTIPDGFQISRTRLVTKNHQRDLSGSCVVLWMMRDQRVCDNNAIYYAQSVASKHNIPLKVVFNLVPKFLDATIRQYGFMINGLKEVEQSLRALEIPFHLLMGDPKVNIPKFVKDHDASLLVTDFSPLRVGLGWIQHVAQSLDENTPKKIPLVQVDAHNVVPCWVASPKLEYSARTFRGKISPLIGEYLREVPLPHTNPTGSLIDCSPIDWEAALNSLQIDRTVKEVDWIVGGAKAGELMVEEFIKKRLPNYDTNRNNPTLDNVSNLSPYFHFGQISVQKVVLKLKALKKFGGAVDTFIEEAVVRRELADNFCYYNPKYDSIEGCYGWAKETLQVHQNDKRPYVYTKEQLENAMTHDDLWNAAQIQMTREGKMHGFLRMYWAKKILEWTNSPEEALSIAIYLNDKYELDGRDPNGYVGCMWSIGGIHDQGWGERPIFGKIRFMNYEGCKRKFDVKKFVTKYPPAMSNANVANNQRTLRF